MRDLPYEIPGDDVYEFFGAYGDVLTVEFSKFPTFPTLCDDNRVIKTRPFVVAIVECGTVINCLHALYVVSLVIVPSPALLWLVPVLPSAGP